MKPSTPDFRWHSVWSLATLVGCGAVSLIASAAAPICPADPSSSSGMPHNDMPHNDMPHNDMPHNGLTADALRNNASLISYLRDHPLNSVALTALGNDVRRLLDKPEARSLLSYVVSCALDETQSVKVTDGQGCIHEFRGQLGYCSDSAPSPLRGWSTGAAPQACQEMVSSCVLARTNALGKRVMISMRDSLNARSLERIVPVDTQYRENHGTNIVSFSPCTGPTPSPENRNCGYSPRYVGRCTASSEVHLVAPHGVFVRICEGVHGCDNEALPTITPGGRRWYSRRLQVKGDPSTGAWKFQCPSEDPDAQTVRGPIGQHRTYSVMLTSNDPATMVARDADVSAPGYPATEAETFPYREGAFYGNLFETCDKVACGVGAKLLAGKQYACSSEIWSDGSAMLADRLCARPSGECFQNQPGTCQAPSNFCDKQSTEVQSRYLSCGYRAQPEFLGKHAVTVYLNHPCDLNNAQNCALKVK